MKQQVTFETHDGSTYCLRLNKQQESGVEAMICDIYAAQDYPFFVGEDDIDSHYILVNDCGEAVGDFDQALHLAKLDVFVLEGEYNLKPEEVLYGVEFDKVYMNRHEFKSLSTLIMEKVPQILSDFYNGLELENEAEMFTEEVKG